MIALGVISVVLAASLPIAVLVLLNARKDRPVWQIAQRRALPGMDPARADVILVGGAIACAVLQWSGATELIVSDRGVRWGLAAELTGCSPCSTP